MVIVVVALHCHLVAVEVVVVTANTNGGWSTVMEARGKECDVAVQHEAPEFLACLDLNLSRSIVQCIKRPDLAGTINVQCMNVCSTISGLLEGQGHLKIQILHF